MALNIQSKLDDYIVFIVQQPGHAGEWERRAGEDGNLHELHVSGVKEAIHMLKHELGVLRSNTRLADQRV